MLPTVMVAIELPAPGAGMMDGTNFTETPFGTLDALSESQCLNPVVILVVTVVVPARPGAIVMDDGFSETLNWDVAGGAMFSEVPATVFP